MLFHVLDALLGTTTKVRVLRVLLQLDSPVSGSEAKRLARVRSAASMWTALDELSDLGILSREQTRGSHLYRINREHDLFPQLVALFEAEAQRLSRLREWAVEILGAASLTDAVDSMILYGSNARGEATARSDVDLLVVTGDEAEITVVRDALLAGAFSLEAKMGLRLSSYVLSRERVAARHADGDPLMQTVASEGRLLLGEPLQEVVNAW